GAPRGAGCAGGRTNHGGGGMSSLAEYEVEPIVQRGITAVITDDVRDFLENKAGIDDSIEVGGYLWTTRGRRNRGEIVVEQVTQVPRVNGTSRGIDLDGDRLSRMERRFHGYYECCGNWHTHPEHRTGERAIPSQGDLRAWVGEARRFGAPCLGLIISPRGYSDERGADWWHPIYSGFVAGSVGERMVFPVDVFVERGMPR